jgi:hypothetical protein
VYRLTGDAQRESLVVTTFNDFHLTGGQQVEVLQKIKEAFIFLINTKNDAGISRLEFGKKNTTLLPKFSHAAAQRNTVRASFVSGKAFQQERFDLRRNRMFQALRFRVGFGPRQADHLREKHFCQLMAKHQVLSYLAALCSQQNLAAALDFDMSITRHALDRSGDRGRSNVKFFGKARADGKLVLLAHFPNGFEVIFLRDAGLFAAQRISDTIRNLRPARRSEAGWRAIKPVIRVPLKFSDK